MSPARYSDTRRIAEGGSGHHAMKIRISINRAAVTGATLYMCLSAPAFAQQTGGDASSAPDSADAQRFALHGQITNIWQYHPAFRSLFQGPQSLDHNNHTNETLDATLYGGASPWQGGEIWLNLEMDQGIAPSDTLGAAGYVNGDGAKVGHKHPYVRLQRAFFRQTIDLGGAVQTVDPDLNQLGETQTENRVVLTAGKFSVGDVFDANKYAHDPKSDFLNWALIDTGSFDYAADAWGYTYGASAEWYQDAWTTRFGVFDLSTVPNGSALTPGLKQFQLDGELERRYEAFDEGGKIAVTGFLSRGHMGSFADALALAALTDSVPNTADVRHYNSRLGVAFNLEQSLTDDLALFARGGIDQDNVESYEYTDIDRSFAAGLSVTGDLWGRKDDTIGTADVVNWIGHEHEAYFAAGGLGILVGDGALPHPGPEDILEVYYNAALIKEVHLTLDSQIIDNPAYNRDRGPVVVVSGRLHAEI